MIEIERVFRCRVADMEAFRAASEASEIRQGYLGEDGPTIRIRDRGGRWVMTIKTDPEGDERPSERETPAKVREEIEFDVPSEQGEALLRLAGDRRVEKTRHVVGRWEVDLYHGALEGLITADCELSRADEPLPPPPPGIELVREVTTDSRYGNQDLASASDEERRALVEEGD